MTNLTHGNWRIGEYQEAIDNETIAIQNEVDSVICVVWPLGEDFDHPTDCRLGNQIRANANLIAAAPDLLAACEEVYAFLSAEDLAWLPKLRAAIAKAKGS